MGVGGWIVEGWEERGCCCWWGEEGEEESWKVDFALERNFFILSDVGASNQRQRGNF